MDKARIETLINEVEKTKQAADRVAKEERKKRAEEGDAFGYAQQHFLSAFRRGITGVNSVLDAGASGKRVGEIA